MTIPKPRIPLRRAIILFSTVAVIGGVGTAVANNHPRPVIPKTVPTGPTSLTVTTAGSSTPAIGQPVSKTAQKPSTNTSVNVTKSAISYTPPVAPTSKMDLQASYCKMVGNDDQQSYETEKARDFNDGMHAINNILNLIGQGETYLESQVNQDVAMYNQELQQLYNQDVALETAPPNTDGYGGCANTLSPPMLIPNYPQYP